MEAPARLTPYIPRERYEWIEAPEDSSFAGFAVEARVNLTNAELRNFRDQVSEIASARMDAGLQARDKVAANRAGGDVRTDKERKLQREANKKIERELRETVDALDRRLWELAAPHVRAWNVYQADDTGETVPAPPPCEAVETSYDVITPAMAQWVAKTIESAYASGKGLSRPSAPPGDSPVPTPTANEGPMEVPDPD